MFCNIVLLFFVYVFLFVCFSLYVTRAGRAFNGTITIGTGETEGGSVSYTDAELSGSVYVFIRAYSSINSDVCSVL